VRRSGRFALLRVLPAVVLTSLLLGLPATTVGHATAGPASPSVSTAVHSTGADFAIRAGYESGIASRVAEPHAPTGPIAVDVVFSPDSGPSLPRTGWEPAARFAAQHGLSAADYARAARYFVDDGLKVTHEWPDRLALSLSGSAGALDRAFGTTLVSGTQNAREVTFPATPPSLPPWMASHVAGVVGLRAGFETFSISLGPTVARPAGTQAPAQLSPDTVYPSLARSIYGVSALYNLTGTSNYPTNQTIALVLWGAGYAPSDLQTFFTSYYSSGFPTPRYTPHPVDGAPSPSDSALSAPDSRAVEEMTLDLEWSGSIAPGANLEAVYAPDGPPPDYSPSSADLTDAFEEALSLQNVSVISMSFMVPESGDASLRSTWDSLLAEAAGRGITVLAASGDDGGAAGTDCSGGASVGYPSSSPYAISVGGTNVTLLYNLGFYSGFNESAWNGSGGGFSSQFGAPSWQEVGSAAGPIGADGQRGLPDVSATAADDFLYFKGGAMEARGTSFATPLWAGLVAEMNQQYGHALGWFTPRLYHVAASQSSGQIGIGLEDVVGGGNCAASATAGWDEATGWGSPRAIPLYEDLVGSYVNLSLAVSPSTVAPGGSVSVVTQLTNRSTGRPIANTTVRMAAVSESSIGPCTGTFSTSAPETNATGWASAELSVPYCYLGSHANVSVLVTTDRLYGNNQTSVAVNLLGLYPPLEVLEEAPWTYVSYVTIMALAVVSGGWLGRRRVRPPARPRVVVSPAAAVPVAPPAAGPGPTPRSAMPTKPSPPTGTTPLGGGPPPAGSPPPAPIPPRSGQAPPPKKPQNT